MPGMLWAIGAAMMVFIGVVSYALTRRYGWGVALALPVLALVAMTGMQWQRQEIAGESFVTLTMSMLLFSAPMLAGVAAGILVALVRARRDD